MAYYNEFIMKIANNSHDKHSTNQDNVRSLLVFEMGCIVGNLSSFFVCLDDACAQTMRHYQHLMLQQTFVADEIQAIDGALEQGWKQHWHAVFFIDYDFATPLLGLPLHSQNQDQHQLHIFWFAKQDIILGQENCQTALDHLTPQETLPAGLANLRLDTEKADYLQDIQSVQDAISRGEVYQINYTTRLHFEAYGNPITLYQKLRKKQAVPYGVLAHLPVGKDHEQWHLGFSPELFLDIQADGVISTEPMKGTAPILFDGKDEQRAVELKNDPKNRAENIMIVDLLRNDLGKIATVGGICVPEPFSVKAYGSVWQMTTKINAKIQDNTSLSQILQAAFPCGSITGAPKRYAMHLIQQLEKTSRGIYTGSVGFIEPCETGLGFYGKLNVVIRSLILQETEEQSSQFNGIMGVGSGIVIDSNAELEYQECGWKSQFLKRIEPDFELIETIKVTQQQAPLWPLHRARLLQSASDLNFHLSGEALDLAWNQALSTLDNQLSYRVKISLQSNSKLNISCHTFKEVAPELQYVCIANTVLNNHNLLRRYKTNLRAVFDQAWQQAEQEQAFDALFFNQNGDLLEGARSNVFLRHGSTWSTPPLDLDILNGVMRQEIMSKPKTHLGIDKVMEKYINKAMLLSADEIVLSNALRGIKAVTLKPQTK